MFVQEELRVVILPILVYQLEEDLLRHAPVEAISFEHEVLHHATDPNRAPICNTLLIDKSPDEGEVSHCYVVLVRLISCLLFLQVELDDSHEGFNERVELKAPINREQVLEVAHDVASCLVLLMLLYQDADEKLVHRVSKLVLGMTELFEKIEQP